MQWYCVVMCGTELVTMGDRGRLVVPAAIRERHGWEQGSVLVLLDSDSGVVFMTRDQLRKTVRRELAGPSLVKELLAERRASAAAEDAA